MSQPLQEHTRKCNRCGACLAACPVYRVLPLETISPRGKTALARRIAEGKMELSSNMARILSQCLLCGSCLQACPSGVQGAHIFSELRREALKRLGPDWRKLLLAKLFSRPGRLEDWARLSRWGRDLLEALLPPQASLLPLPDLSHLPPLSKPFFRHRLPPVVHPAGRPRGRLAYFFGCATDFLFAELGQAVVRTLVDCGWEVHLPPDQACCGVPVFMSGNYEKALWNMQHNLDLLTSGPWDLVVVDCATCGMAFKKEYPRIMESLGQDTRQALILSEKVRDVMQVLAEDAPVWKTAKGKASPPVPVTYHDPCHLAKGQGIREEPRLLLKSLPQVEYLEMAQADACCGGGGSFRLEHPRLAGKITQLKVANILESGARVVATGCPSCRLTLASALKGHSVRVCHPLELISPVQESP